VNPCDQLLHALGEGVPLDEALRIHADACAACGALVSLDRKLPAVCTAEVPGELPASLREAVAREASPTAPYSPWPRMLAPVGLTLLLAVAVMALSPRRDLAHQPQGLYWAVALAWLASVVTGLVLVLYRTGSGLGCRATTRWRYLAVAVLAFEALAWTTTRPVPGSMMCAGMAAMHQHLACAAFGGVLAALMGVSVFRVARRTAAVCPTSAGATAGTAAGFAAVLALHLECAFADPLHVAASHLVPVVLGAAVGAFAGRRYLAP
jgi:hypothetical protein